LPPEAAIAATGHLKRVPAPRTTSDSFRRTDGLPCFHVHDVFRVRTDTTQQQKTVWMNSEPSPASVQK